MHTEEKYIALGKLAASRASNKDLLSELTTNYSVEHDCARMDALGLHLQVVVKSSPPNYLHGYVLAAVARHYMTKHEGPVVAVDVGTARGFSALVLSEALRASNRKGVVHTIDIVDSTTPQHDNCLLSAKWKRPVSTVECAKHPEGAADVVEEYIRFHVGDSLAVIHALRLPRIHIAFLDGHHAYEHVKAELALVSSKQQKGDVIVCDDYTRTQFDGLCRAVDEFASSHSYMLQIHRGVDESRVRGYAVLTKQS